MTDERPQNMIFTLEDDNEHAPTYESRQTSLDDSLKQIRQRYRRTEEILAERRSKLVGDTDGFDDETEQPINDLPQTPVSDENTDFRLPEIEMPPERDYQLDDDSHDNQNNPDNHDDDTENHQENQNNPEDNSLNEAILKQENHQDDEPLAHTDEDDKGETALSKLFKRYKAERATSPIQPPPEPVLPVVTENRQPEPTNGQTAYLHYREHEHNQRVEQSAIAETDIGILIEEDWLAAQNAIKTDGKPHHTVHLQPTQEVAPAYQLSPTHQEADIAQRPLLTVNVYDLPDLPSTRKIRVLSEKELVAELQRKLRPHLSHAVAGLMHNVLQRKLATLSYDLQMMLNEETPRLVEDVLEYNMANILREIKEQL